MDPYLSTEQGKLSIKKLFDMERSWEYADFPSWTKSHSERMAYKWWSLHAILGKASSVHTVGSLYRISSSPLGGTSTHRGIGNNPYGSLQP